MCKLEAIKRKKEKIKNHKFGNPLQEQIQIFLN